MTTIELERTEKKIEGDSLYISHAFCDTCEPEGTPYPHRSMCGKIVENAPSPGIRGERCVVCVEMWKLPNCPVCGATWR